MLYQVTSDFDVVLVEDHYNIVVKVKSPADDAEDEIEVIELLEQWFDTLMVIDPRVMRKAKYQPVLTDPYLRLTLEVDGGMNVSKDDVISIEKAVRRLCVRASEVLDAKKRSAAEARKELKVISS